MVQSEEKRFDRYVSGSFSGKIPVQRRKQRPTAVLRPATPPELVVPKIRLLYLKIMLRKYRIFRIMAQRTIIAARVVKNTTTKLHLIVVRADSNFLTG